MHTIEFEAHGATHRGQTSFFVDLNSEVSQAKVFYKVGRTRTGTFPRWHRKR